MKKNIRIISKYKYVAAFQTVISASNFVRLETRQLSDEFWKKFRKFCNLNCWLCQIIILEKNRFQVIKTCSSLVESWVSKTKSRTQSVKWHVCKWYGSNVTNCICYSCGLDSWCSPSWWFILWSGNLSTGNSARRMWQRYCMWNEKYVQN